MVQTQKECYLVTMTKENATSTLYTKEVLFVEMPIVKYAQTQNFKDERHLLPLNPIKTDDDVIKFSG